MKIGTAIRVAGDVPTNELLNRRRGTIGPPRDESSVVLFEELSLSQREEIASYLSNPDIAIMLIALYLKELKTLRPDAPTRVILSDYNRGYQPGVDYPNEVGGRSSGYVKEIRDILAEVGDPDTGTRHGQPTGEWLSCVLRTPRPPRAPRPPENDVDATESPLSQQQCAE